MRGIMKIRNHSLMFRITIFVLFIFFGLLTLSRAALSLGTRFQQAGLLRLAGVLFPLDGKAFLEYGRLRLRSSSEGRNVPENPAKRKKTAEDAISALQSAIRRNLLDYQAHFYLGSAWLSLPNPDNQSLRRGVDSLHRAIRLKGGKDMVMNTRAVFYSMENWNRLNDQDRRLAGKQLRKIIARLSQRSFEQILKRWETNCMDIGIFETDNILEDAPRFYKSVADALARMQRHESIRRVYMLNHEIHTLNDVRNDFQRLTPGAPDLLKNLKALHLRLEQNIQGFYKLIPGNQFKAGLFHDIRQRIDFHILHQYFSSDAWKSDLALRAELLDFAEHCAGELSRDVLPDFHHYLEEQDFWHIDLLQVHYLRNRIFYRLQDYPAVIRNIESLRLSPGDISDAPDQRYERRLLLLLADSLMASRLFTRASALVGEMERRAPEDKELWLRGIRIAHVMGEEPTQADTQTLEKKNAGLRESRLLTVRAPTQEQDICLLEDNSVTISCAPEMNKKRQRFHLFQVFVNNEIRFESYINDVQFPVTIKITPFERFSTQRARIELKRVKEISGDERRKKSADRG